MASVWMWVRAELRARWRGWLALAVLIGLAGGLVLACLAGARRADSAYRRFLTASNASDLVMYAVPVDFEAIRRLPEVEDTASVFYVALSTELERRSDSKTTPATQTLVTPVASSDRGFSVLDKPKVLSGRRPAPDRPQEVAVTPSVADRMGLKVGSTVRVESYRTDQLGEILGNSGGVPEGPRVELKVVGIEVAPGELAPREQVGSIHLSPAFLSTHGDQIAMVPGITVKLRNGDHDLAQFKGEMVRLSGSEPVEIVSTSYEGSLARRGIHLEAQALRLFA
ncbi:MAG TPA: hypothetical protein VF711_11585, partial [Acidimicrobiales bacterium]